MSRSIARQLAEDAVEWARGESPVAQLTRVRDRIEQGVQSIGDLNRVTERVLEVLAEALNLIGRCGAPGVRREPICGRWYVKARAHQEYCSRNCQARTALRRARTGGR